MSKYIALDIGDKRIGVAIADSDAPFPAPLTTLEAGEHLTTEFAALLKKNKVAGVIIGLPRNQKGEETAQTERVKYIATLLNIPSETPVYWQDESLTSVKAEEELKKRKKSHSKGDIDALAATYILEDFIREHTLTDEPSSPEPAINNESAPEQTKDMPLPVKPKKLKKMMRILAGLVVLAIVAAIGWYIHALTPANSSKNYSVVSVKAGSGSRQIATELESRGVIRSAQAFMIYIRLNSINNLQAGEYRLSSSQSVKSIVDTIAGGKVTSINVLISPGLRLDQIVALLQKDGYTKADIDKALVAVRNHLLLKDLPADAKLEGYLFPETYKIGPDTSAEDLIRLMLDTFQQRVTLEIRDGIANQGLTFHQAVVLASIVQKEVSDTSVQPTVAQVFLKRFKTGIMLGSDVTYMYAAKTTGQTASPDLDSPYNTRKYPGLPPTAIANFNLSALEAVAAPTKTDYLFFVAGDDGQTYFSSTLEEHQALVQQHCKKLCG